MLLKNVLFILKKDNATNNACMYAGLNTIFFLK